MVSALRRPGGDRLGMGGPQLPLLPLLSKRARARRRFTRGGEERGSIPRQVRCDLGSLIRHVLTALAIFALGAIGGYLASKGWDERLQ